MAILRGEGLSLLRSQALEGPSCSPTMTIQGMLILSNNISKEKNSSASHEVSSAYLKLIDKG